MKNICLYFQVHQPLHLKTFRFFEIGNNHLYYDDYTNKALIRKTADSLYLPTNRVLLNLIKEHNGKFRISFSISGTLIRLLEKYATDVIQSFKELADTGCVEFLSGTQGYSLASQMNDDEFSKQVKLYDQKIMSLFGMKPKVFVNTGMIYSDKVGEMISGLGYNSVLTEGTDQILKWRSPNYMYNHPERPQLRILMNNFKLSEDIKADISENIWTKSPMSPDNFMIRLNSSPAEEHIFNVFIDYKNFKRQHDEYNGMVEFLYALLPKIFSGNNFHFCTPSDLTEDTSPCWEISCPDIVSSLATEVDFNTGSWNDLQTDAIYKLYSLKKSIDNCEDPEIRESWQWLQSSDHFFYMSSIWFENNDLSGNYNQYDSPYLAYINYMNILNDFSIRLNTNHQDELIPNNKLNKKLAREKITVSSYDSMLEKKISIANRSKMLHKVQNPI